MKHSTLILKICFLVTIGVFVSGCSSERPVTASLILHFTSPTENRSLGADIESQITKIKGELTSGDGYDSVPFTTYYGVVSLESITPGNWSVQATAYTAHDTPIASGVQTFILTEGENGAFSITLSPSLTGSGSLRLQFTVPEEAGITGVTAEISGILYSADLPEPDATSDICELIADSLPAGRHSITLSFIRGESSAGVMTEMVTIWNGITSGSWINADGSLSEVRHFTENELFSGNAEPAEIRLPGLLVPEDFSYTGNTFNYQVPVYDSPAFVVYQGAPGQTIRYVYDSGEPVTYYSGKVVMLTSPAVRASLVITVTAPDRETEKIYTITLNRVFCITYDSSGSTAGTPPPVSYPQAGVNYMIAENTMTKQDSMFYCWSSLPGRTGDYYFAGTEKLFTSDTTLYPVWRKYDGAIGSTGGIFTQTDGTNSFQHTISPFEMGRYEVTYDLWYTVRLFAESNGYTLSLSGREGNDGVVGAPPTDARYEPATMMNLRDTLVWCNAYSQMVGLTPVYYTDAAFTTPLKVSNDSETVSTTLGSADNPYVNWNANGYRLPTEAEFKYAASYNNGTNWTPANYASGASADTTNQLETDKVAWYSVNTTKTMAVGTKAPNALGFYDLSGNVWEYCWDPNLTYPVGPQTDYRGGTFVQQRMLNCGGWNVDASYMKVGLRHGRYNYQEADHIGFRVVRSL